MVPRFLVPDLDVRQPDVVLPRDEAEHLARVLRLQVGDTVGVFDGRGVECRARVADVSRVAVRVSLIERVETRAPKVALTLVQSVLKPPAMDDVVRDATMVGVDTIRPVVSARTTVKSTVLARSPERWRRIAVAAAKQCGQAWIPEIHDVARFDEWTSAERSDPAFLLVEPSAAPSNVTRVRDLLQQPTPARAAVVVGPEGGWTVEERDAALRAGCTAVSLGPLTLRADAVPLVACATLLAAWDS